MDAEQNHEEQTARCVKEKKKKTQNLFLQQKSFFDNKPEAAYKSLIPALLFFQGAAAYSPPHMLQWVLFKQANGTTQLALTCLLLHNLWPNEANAQTRFFILLS